MRSFLLTCALTAAHGIVSAEPPPEARARAALALAGAKRPAATAPAAIAPAPRPAVFDNFAEAKIAALSRGLPTVVFVGCSTAPKVDGAITAAVASMEDVQPGSVVVYYPSNGYLWQDAQMKAPVHLDQLRKAVEGAGKKIPVPAKAVGKLDWS